MPRLITFCMCIGWLVLWRMLAGMGYPENKALLASSLIVFTLAALHAFLFRGDSALHPATVIATLAAAVIGVMASVMVLSLLHPALLIAIIVGLSVPLIGYSRRQRVRRGWSESGRCETCGYDLRASPERCPECNTPVPEEQLRRLRIRDELRAAREAKDTEHASQSASPERWPEAPDEQPPQSPAADNSAS